MKLSAYIKNPEQRAAIAKALGVTVEAVRLWEKGKRTPRLGKMREISGLTGGDVTPMDFMEAAS